MSHVARAGKEKNVRLRVPRMRRRAATTARKANFKTLTRHLTGADFARLDGSRVPWGSRNVINALPAGTQTSLSNASRAMKASGRTQAKAHRPIAGAALRGDIAKVG